MQYVQKYAELYPLDKVTVIGGAAAYLHLRKSGVNIALNDIDININTGVTGKVIVERWVTILPPSYTVKYDSNYPIGIFSLFDTSGHELSIDVFINQEYIDETEYIEAFQVEKLENLINKYNRDLLGRKKDLELIRDGVIKWNIEEIPILIDKYNRLLERLRLLVNCLVKSKRPE